MTNYLLPLLNLLLVTGFIIDRVFRLRSIKEYKEAKDAQIANLAQQLANEQANNDLQLTEMHKKRYENLKILIDEKELEKNQLIDQLIVELNAIELAKQRLENERKILLPGKGDQV